MYSVTNDFLLRVREPSRKVTARIYINNVLVMEDKIINFTLERAFSGNMPVIGSVSSAKLTLNLINSAIPAVLVGVPIDVRVGINDAYVKLGFFYATAGDVTKTAKSVTIECFDKMAGYDDITYESDLTYPTILPNIMNELTTKYGVTFATQTHYDTEFNQAPVGTVRQVLSEIAISKSSNAVMNWKGEVYFVQSTDTGFSIDASNYIDFKLQSEAPIKISQLMVKHGDETFVRGDGTGYAVSVDSTGITNWYQTQYPYSGSYPLTYTAYSMKTQGMPHLDLGDKFTFTDSAGTIRTLVVGNHKLTFNGGLISEFSMDAPQSKTVQAAPTGGSSIARAVSQARADVMMAVNDATKLITGAQGGVVVTNFDENGKPKELLIMDTNDINTATRVWRWNIEGLGYSSNGYMGPYKLAITADGKINADFITVGTLSADVIQVNSITNDKLSIDLQGIISSKVSNTVFNEAVGAIADELQTYADKTDNLETGFNNLVIGAPNMLRNSRGNYGNKAWECDGLTISGHSDVLSVRYCGAGNVLRFERIGSSPSYAYSDKFVLIPGRTYTVSGMYYVDLNAVGMTVSVIGQTLGGDTRDADYVHPVFMDNEYSGGAYKPFSLTFTADQFEERGFLQVEHGGSTEEAYLYLIAKFEEGDRAGVWSADPDDLVEYAEDTIAASLTVLNTTFQQAADSFMSEVGTRYLAKEEADVIESSMSTKLTQTSSDFTMLFDTVTGKQSEDAATNNGKFVEIQKYIKFVNGDIVLGEVGNQLRLQIQSDKIAFMSDNTEVAYFSNRKLYVFDGEFINSMRIGNFGFLPRKNGNLSLRRI